MRRKSLASEYFCFLFVRIPFSLSSGGRMLLSLQTLK